MSKHTPGPWRVVDVPGEASHIVGRDNFTVVRQGYVSDMDTANARLIAAAPDLLAAVRTFLNIGKDGGPLEAQYAAAILQARAAVAKAEGYPKC